MCVWGEYGSAATCKTRKIHRWWALVSACTPSSMLFGVIPVTSIFISLPLPNTCAAPVPPTLVYMRLLKLACYILLSEPPYPDDCCPYFPLRAASEVPCRWLRLEGLVPRQIDFERIFQGRNFPKTYVFKFSGQSGLLPVKYMTFTTRHHAHLN